MPSVHLARMAMASRFELVLHGEDEAWLRAAGEEALSEIQRLDAQLSNYRESSELSRLNARAHKRPVQVEPRLFALLQSAQRMYEQTEGAFDVTVGPLMRAWGFFRDEGRLPSDLELERARATTGMHLVQLNPEDRSVFFTRTGVEIDLGGIGKGYAVNEAIGILREAGVQSAFLHGGTSTSYGLGAPPGDDAWRVSVHNPGATDADHTLLSVVDLVDASLSVSAVWGRSFVFDGRLYGHVLDPRIGRPVDGAQLTAVASASATEADALSTALLVHGRRSGNLLHAMQDRHRALLLFSSSDSERFDVIEAGLSSPESARRHVISPQ